MNEKIDVTRVIDKLDAYLYKNDYDAACRHLLYWTAEAQNAGDLRAELSFKTELMGLYRKLGKKSEAIAAAERSAELVEKLNLTDSVTAGTVYVDAATVYNAFSDQNKSLYFFEKALPIYEKYLTESDKRLPALYNNFALNLTALKRFTEAKAYYEKALSLGKGLADGKADMAITYLNLANFYEAQKGFFDGLEDISDCLSKARDLLEALQKRDGYYAFVCEKCAGTFGYYGMTDYARELKARAKEIYERA